MNRLFRTTWILIALLAINGTLVAQAPPEKTTVAAEKELRHPALDFQTRFMEVGQLSALTAGEAQSRLARLGVNAATAQIDQRSGRFATLMPTTPLVAARGASEKEVRRAFRGYLASHQGDLGIDLAEVSSFRITSHNEGALHQIYAERALDGIPVRGSYLSAVVSKGSLILLGTHQWGDRPAPSERAPIALDEAHFAAEGYLAPFAVTREWGEGELIYVVVAKGNGPRGRGPTDFALGRGYSYQLVWSIKLNMANDGGNWELYVDAHTGEILANQDRNVYAEAKGGVLPVSNDGIVPDGVEQAGWPMPFMDIGALTTDTGGNVAATGSLTASFSGPYVEIFDNCGPASLTQVGGLNWGISAGTDCTTPGLGGAGNTHASRTGFYELNKIMEMARGQLPTNTWLQSRLRSNMNINNTCNAFWNGTVNFYRSGGGCSNTGEIAGVFDHEWGHGMDANDATPGIASPSGEGIADIYTALRLNDSCIGRNFRSTVCAGNGDPCLTCTGVRDIDYAKRASGLPHDFSWSNLNCAGSVHCVGGVYSEAVWSLWKRNLQSPPYSMDNNTAHELVNRLTFIGAGGTGTWFSGSPPNGGCAATSGYMNYLAADDDNANLNDGTPHMTAIYNAFNNQQIACSTPAVVDSGCAGTPTAAPVVTTTSSNQAVALSWSAVPDATKYGVYRTEGVFACDFGKVKLGETVGTTWNDSGLQNGRDYSYVVIPMGIADSCFGPASACATGVPVGTPPPPDTVPPGAPTGLTATAGNASVQLSWSANTEPDLAGYSVYRATVSGGPFTLLNGILLTGTSFSDTGLTNGTTYFYVLTATDASSNESPQSTEASATPTTAPPPPPPPSCLPAGSACSVNSDCCSLSCDLEQNNGVCVGGAPPPPPPPDTTPPAAPTGVGASAGNASVQLSWSANTEPDLAGYSIYRATVSGGPYTLLNGALVTGTSFSDTGLTNGTTYYYVLTATDISANESTRSTEVSATPTTTPPPPPSCLPTGSACSVNSECCSLFCDLEQNNGQCS